MSSLLSCIAALAVASNSAALPDPLRALAESTGAFADSIAKLNKETDAVAADAKLVHNVAANKTAREAVLDDMGRTLTAGMPSQSKYDDAEKAALKAAAIYKTADLVAMKAELALKHQARAGTANLTATAKAELQSLRKASRDADAESAAAKKDLEAKVAEAEHANTELLEATRAHARKFEGHVEELMRAARRQEAEAKKAMRAAISKGREAAHAEMKKRKVSEQTGEEARELAEEWAEGHEDAIEDASDHASDDLERIYEPVQELVRSSLHVAERNAAVRREHMHRLLESAKRVELLQLLQDSSSTETTQGASWITWAAGYSAAVAGVLLVVVSRRRMGAGLQQPLLG